MFLFPEFHLEEDVMNHRTILFILYGIMLMLGNLFAQEWGNNPVPLRLDEAIREAVDKNPLLQIALARVDAAESRITEARSALLPQVRLSGRAGYLSEVPEFSLTLPLIGTQTLFPSIERNYGARFTVQQTLFTGFRVQKNLEMSEHNALAAGYDYGRDRSELRLTVTTAYWNLYRARRLEQVLGLAVDQISAHLEDVRNFRLQGIATDLDVLKVQTQLSDIQVKQTEAGGNAQIAQMSLNSLIGKPLETSLSLVDHPVTDDQSRGETDEQVGSYMQRAQVSRMEVASAKERLAMQKAAVAAAQGGWYPQVILLGNYDYARPNQRIIPPKDAWEKSWDIGVSVQWNLWDWFATSSQTSQAQAGLAQTEAMVRQVNDAVALEAAQSYFRVSEARKRIELSSIGTKQAEESYRITKERFKQGVSTTTDLLDAEIALLQARLNETQAVVDFVIQKEKLSKALGGDTL